MLVPWTVDSLHSISICGYSSEAPIEEVCLWFQRIKGNKRKLQGNSQRQYSERVVECDTGQMDRRSFPSSGPSASSKRTQ